MSTKPRTARTNPAAIDADDAPARPDALGATADACDSWAKALELLTPEAAAALRTAAGHTRRARTVGQIAIGTAKGLRGALAAMLDAAKGNH